MLVENAAKEEKTILNKLKIYRRPEQPRVERFISSVSLWWRVKFDLFSWEKEVRTRTSVASPVRMPCMLARHSWRNKHEAVSNNREKPFTDADRNESWSQENKSNLSRYHWNTEEKRSTPRLFEASNILITQFLNVLHTNKLFRQLNQRRRLQIKRWIKRKWSHRLFQMIPNNMIRNSHQKSDKNNF